MRLAMVGLDFQTAAVETREAFSPARCDQAEVLRRALGSGASGCALLSTCNRAELYLSHPDGEEAPDGEALFRRAIGREGDARRARFVERRGRDALVHLMRVAGGMRSSVPGDDQIITQVRSAIETAREAGTADAMLEAVFRAAVTAGKKIKTRVSFAREGGSVADEAVRAITGFFASSRGTRALVVGNGVIGRLTASGLAAAGFAVSVTLSRREGGPDAPDGCSGLGYDDRYRAMAECDVVVGATASPGHAVSASEVARLPRRPGLFVDLAVPRDIDPAVGDLPGVTLWNVDDLRVASVEGLEEQFALAEDIIAGEAERFEIWRTNRSHRARRMDRAPSDFPLFINLRGAVVLIAGGGRVAARRAGALLGFGASVRVAAPELSPELEKLLGRDGLEWLRTEYRSELLGGVTLAIAATDSREVNRRVGLDARERGILVSVADRREECSFYFPAIVKSGVLTAGIVSGNGDHALVKKAAAMLRREMELLGDGGS